MSNTKMKHGHVWVTASQPIDQWLLSSCCGWGWRLLAYVSWCCSSLIIYIFSVWENTFLCITKKDTLFWYSFLSSNIFTDGFAFTLYSVSEQRDKLYGLDLTYWSSIVLCSLSPLDYEIRYGLKLSEVMSLQMENYVSYSRKGMGREICLQHRVYQKDSTLLINNRLSLYPWWHTTGSICDYHPVFWLSHTFLFLHKQWKKWHRQLLKLGSVSSEVPWDILFMLVSWWCKSEKLWDVLLKRTYVCRERLSLHSRWVFGRDQCALNSQLSTVV